MTTRSLGIGLIGVGRHGSRYIHHLLHDLPGVHLPALRAFVHAIETKTSPPITQRDGCRAVEAADACYHSAKQGGATVDVGADVREA